MMVDRDTVTDSDQSQGDAQTFWELPAAAAHITARIGPPGVDREKSEESSFCPTTLTPGS